MTTDKRWGDEPYYGLDREFDPGWFLTDEQKALEEELIERCRTVLRPVAIESDRTNRYPRENLEAIAEMGLLATVVPKKWGGAGENHVGITMVTETIARYGCPSTALIYMMHMVAVAGLVYRAHDNPEILSLLKPHRSRVPDRLRVVHRSRDRRPLLVPEDVQRRAGRRRLARQKKAAWTTSSGYADWYISQTTSPDFGGDYSDLSVFLSTRTRSRATRACGTPWACTATSRGPSRSTPTIPENRIVGWPGDGAASNDEAIDPLAYLMYAGAYNGVAMGCIDVAKRHVTRKAHAQYGRRVADYPTIQDAFGQAICDAQASRLFAYSFARALDDRTDDGSWEMYERDPHVKPRATLTSWGLVPRCWRPSSPARSPTRCCTPAAGAATCATWSWSAWCATRRPAGSWRPPTRCPGRWSASGRCSARRPSTGGTSRWTSPC